MGNYLGDLLRGKELRALPLAVQRGVEMHRAIDQVTDDDPDVRALNKLVAVRHGRYAPVLTDIGFDYYLCKNWDQFGPEPFPEFSVSTYQNIIDARPLMNEKVAGYATNMAREEWLRLYTTHEGMNKVFHRLKGRLSKPELLVGVDTLLTDFAVEFNETFLLLFPRLQKLADGYRP